MFFGVLTIFMSSFIKKCDAHATEYYSVACASHFLINDDIKIVRTPKNMAASVVNLPGMTLQPLYKHSTYI